jgi:ChrR-like protein with cupin domain
VPEGDWRVPAGNRADGIYEQILSADSEGRAYTRLLRFEPGTSTPNGPQVHDFWEEVFIVQGDLTDLRFEQHFRAGMYAFRPPRHGTRSMALRGGGAPGRVSLPGTLMSRSR